MTSVPADSHRDHETMEQLLSIAKEIFARYGIDLSTAMRGGGWSNATWLAGWCCAWRWKRGVIACTAKQP